MDDRFHGIIPAMATPFSKSHEVDYGALRALIDWYVECGVHGLSICGSQGEFFALDRDEHILVMERTVDAVGGRIPVYAGTGAVSTRAAISLTQAAQTIGVDMAMAITPSFISPKADELAQHFEAIARSTTLPILLYNNPPRTHLNITPALFAQCAAIENIVGIKDSSGDITQVIEYVRLTQGRKLAFAGRDTIILAILLHGGHGAISPAANVFPRLLVKLYDEFRGGRLDRARFISDQLAPLRLAWDLGSFPVVIKEAMALVGRDAGPARLPIQPLHPDARAELSSVIERLREADAALSQTLTR
ncbi:MAG TPA: 4-hydroxy-tetrahydrodipicolinate synthase [Alphaproteobacteria bacterium]|nr:4-hydroxy-tetrahydrodipicolinate synthase [Alphaproteobacteria bacterium]